MLVGCGDDPSPGPDDLAFVADGGALVAAPGVGWFSLDAIGATATPLPPDRFGLDEELAADDERLWVLGPADDPAGRELRGVELASGRTTHLLTVDAAATDLQVGDGAVWFRTPEGIFRFDPADRAPALFWGGEHRFADLPTQVRLSDIAVVRSGGVSALADDNRAAVTAALRFRPTAYAIGDDRLWVALDAQAATADATAVVVELIAEVEADTRTVLRVWPTADAAAVFAEPNQVRVGDVSITVTAGATWVIDAQANGAVMRIDHETGRLEVVHEPCADAPSDADCTTARFRPARADVWLAVAPLVDDGTGRRTGELEVQRLDADTGDLLSANLLEDLINP